MTWFDRQLEIASERTKDWPDWARKEAGLPVTELSMIPNGTSALTGWTCPKCGSVWGPCVSGCEKCNGTQDANVANRLFLDAARKIDGVLSAKTFTRLRGGTAIDLVVDNIVSGAGWEMTKLRCRIEDEFPSVTLDIHIRQDAPASAPRDTYSREQIQTRLDAFTEATRRLSEAVANGARTSGMWSSKATEEDR